MYSESFEWAESDPVRWCEEILERADYHFSDGRGLNGADFFSVRARRKRAVGLAAALAGVEESETETWNRWRELEAFWRETETGGGGETETGACTETETGDTSECVVCETGMSRSELKRQVKVDVDRSMAFFDRHEKLDEKQREAKRERLTKIIQETMQGRDGGKVDGVELQYLQGAHELCLVLMELAGDETPNTDIVDMCKRVFMTRVFVMHSSLSLAVAVHMILTQVSLLIKQFAPEVLRSLVNNTHSPSPDLDWNGDGSELHFILPWMVTLFSHSIKQFDKVIQLWNILFAYPPPYLVYFLGAAVVIHFQTNPPSAEHSSFDESIGDIPIEIIFSTTLQWLQARPFRSLSDDCHRLLGSHRDASDFSLWFDADGSSIRAFGPESILPPLWSPCLGADCLGGQIGGSICRAFSLRASSIWTARVAEVNAEWKLVKKGRRAAIQTIDILTLALLRRLAHSFTSAMLQRLTVSFRSVLGDAKGKTI